MNKKVIMVRGCPGSGKSTYLSLHYPTSVVCSADHFMTNSNGNYAFNNKRLAEVHLKCYNCFCKALQNGEPLVALDNTNIKNKDLKRYLEQANQNGYAIEIVRLLVDCEIAFKRGTHGVPMETIVRMQDSLQAQPLLLHEKVIHA